MRKMILVILLIGVLTLVPVVGAQVELSFDLVQIQFWPEYDSPEMLVIYTFELPADQSLPVDISVRIPSRVGAPTAVAVLEDAQLVTRGYSLSEVGDWTEVILTTDSPTIHLEYYDPALNIDGEAREFSYEWLSDHAVDELVVAFKQPVHATQIVFSPDLGVLNAGEDELDFYVASMGGLPAGEEFTFSIEYQKMDELLSVDMLLQNAGQTVPEPAQPAATNEAPDWIWYIIGIGAVIMAGGGMYLWYVNTPEAFSSYRQKKARSAGRSVGGFCHKCGTKALREDKYCRECGEKLRN